MTPSELLTAAADRIRDLAAHYLVDAADVPDRHKWWVYFNVDRNASAEGRAWIAALSPAIAPHLETWLRSTASRLEAWLPTGWPIREDEAAALRFALAILGKTAEEVDAARRQAEGSGVEAP